MLAALEDAVERFDLDTAHLERVGLFDTAKIYVLAKYICFLSRMLSSDPHHVFVALMVQDAELLLQDLQKKPNDVALLSQLIIGWYGIVVLQCYDRIDMDSVHLHDIHGIVELRPCDDIDMDWVHNWMENTQDSSNKTAQEQEIVHQKEKEMLATEEGRLTVETMKRQFAHFIQNRVYK